MGRVIIFSETNFSVCLPLLKYSLIIKMRTIIAFALLLFAAPLFAWSPEHQGDKWQHQSAAEKQDVLMQQCLANTKPYGWYSVRLGELFTEDMNVSFDSEMDDMPKQHLVEERPKVIHSVGAVAECSFKITNTNTKYTGLFQSGAKNSFIRISSAKAPDMKEGIVPGISMKFMRDNVPSGNVFAMYKLSGQTSFNFFLHDLTNHPPLFKPTELSEKLLIKQFKTASKWPTMLGLSSMAKFDEQGNESSSPDFPFRIVFHPTAEMHTKFPDTAVKDNEYYIKQLEQMGVVGKLYDVYVQDSPFDDVSDLTKIGEVIQTGSFTGTKYGDKTMFFQHTRMEEDVKYKPEWNDQIEKVLDMQENTAYPPGYSYPDIPY